MLILRGTLRAATQLGGGTNRKTGEIVPLRDVLQVETLDNRGLVQVNTITVPDHKAYSDQVGKVINLPVRAWAQNATVNYVYENTGAAA